MKISSEEARAILNRDRHWCIYALGDLDPRREKDCVWYGDGKESAALLYREFDTPILFATGGPAAMRAAMLDTDRCFVQIPIDHLETVAARFPLAWTRRMHRLKLNPSDFRPTGHHAVSLLGAGDEACIRALYADGAPSHESPDFFFASQLDDATFHGIRLDDGSLACAGGTHLFSQIESIGAVGNIYTHRRHRGRGYAAAVTSAIVQSLIGRGIETIALNVKQGNDGAMRIYERLGFRHYCDYWEGLTASPPSS